MLPGLANNYELLVECSSSLFYVITECSMERARLAATLELVHTCSGILTEPLASSTLALASRLTHEPNVSRVWQAPPDEHLSQA